MYSNTGTAADLARTGLFWELIRLEKQICGVGPDLHEQKISDLKTIMHAARGGQHKHFTYL